MRLAPQRQLRRVTGAQGTLPPRRSCRVIRTAIWAPRHNANPPRDVSKAQHRSSPALIAGTAAPRVIATSFAEAGLCGPQWELPVARRPARPKPMDDKRAELAAVVR